MMRGGSIFAKYCQKSGSRQFGTSRDPREILEYRLAREREIMAWGWPQLIVYGMETAAYKALLGYIGYKLAVSVSDSVNEAEELKSKIEALSENNRLLEKKE